MICNMFSLQNLELFLKIIIVLKNINKITQFEK